MHSLAYAGFSKGGGAGNLKVIMTIRRNFLHRFSLVFGPKLGEDKKKEKRSSLRFSLVLCSNFLPKLQTGGPCRNFAYYSMLIIL